MVELELDPATGTALFGVFDGHGGGLLVVWIYCLGFRLATANVRPGQATTNEHTSLHSIPILYMWLSAARLSQA